MSPAGSGVHIPNTSFVNVLVRILAANTALEDNVELNVDRQVTDDITFSIFNILSTILQRQQESTSAGSATTRLMTPADSVSLFVNLVKVCL